MKRSHNLVQILISSSFLISSCMGAKSTSSETLQAPVITSQSIVDTISPWIDQLFFNEGQLCQHLRQMHQDQQGNLWFGTNVYEIIRYDGDSLRYFAEADGIQGGRITAIHETPDGNLWFGSSEGLIHYDGSQFETHRTGGTYFDDEIWSLHPAGDGKWLVGSTGGAFMFDSGTFSRIDVPRATVNDPQTIYSKDRITSILKAVDGTIYYGTDGYGITKYDGKRYVHITTDDGLPDNVISSIFQDSKGRIWIGTMYGGISLYEGSKFTNFTQDGIIEGVEIGALFEDKNGDIWFAAENHGVYRYDGKTFTNYYEDSGLNTNGILCIMRDREGRFWFGGWGGLYRMDDEKFTHVGKNGPWSINLD